MSHPNDINQTRRFQLFTPIETFLLGIIIGIALTGVWRRVVKQR